MESDSKALKILVKEGYTFDRGLIKPPYKNFIETPLVKEAIDYLCSEYDYAWEEQ